LVNYDKEIDCASEFVGLAKTSGIKPIQTWTCSSYKGQKLHNSQVAATSAHEFIHAVGLGHTFYKKGDLMCSLENGKQTCPGTFSKSSTPSSLNLAATAKLYGTDGFKNPNNNYVTRGMKFYLGDSSGPVSTTTTTKSTTTPQPKPVPPVTYSPKIKTYLELHVPEGVIREGDHVKIWGFIYWMDGNTSWGVPNSEITILDSRSYKNSEGLFPLIGKVEPIRYPGYFEVTWTAHKHSGNADFPGWDGKLSGWNLIASYPGDSKYESVGVSSKTFYVQEKP